MPACRHLAKCGVEVVVRKTPWTTSCESASLPVIPWGRRRGIGSGLYALDSLLVRTWTPAISSST